MNWVVLFIAGLFETAWAVGMKYSHGFTMAVSVVLLSYSLKSLPVGTAYAVWTGIGAVGTAILGIYLFGESKDLVRLLFIALIIIGIMGLRFYPAK